MIRQRVRVGNKLGLHARAAAKLVRLASGYHCDIRLSREAGDRQVDCKSILGILMLTAGLGTILQVTTEGQDEQLAADAINRLFEEGFGEEE
jgi:phosphocarrier protein HPr